MKKNYSDLLNDPRWQKKRDEILSRDEHHCRLCGKSNDLHVHHILYEDNTEPWDYDESYLITVCEFCHNRIHSQMQENSKLKERCRFIEDDLVYRTIRYITNSCPRFIYDFNQLTDIQKRGVLSELLKLINEINNPKEECPAFYERKYVPKKEESPF